MNGENINMSSNICRPGRDFELQVHDGIIGAITLLSVVGGTSVDPRLFWVAGLIGLVMFSSAFTGFCPLHFVLSKVMPADS